MDKIRVRKISNERWVKERKKTAIKIRRYWFAPCSFNELNFI